MKKRIIKLLVILFTVILLALALHGMPGNPSMEILNNSVWKEGGPFELSPERGRFALTYSLIEDQSFEFSLPVARFATPDLGYINGKYVSLFAPGISFLTIPGYQLGKLFGFSQVGTYAVISFFAVLNVILIYVIAVKLGAKKTYSMLASIAFLFATPAFTYAVTLYQHHVSVFFILAGIYVYLNIKGITANWILWFLIAASILVDYPNFFLMLPLGILSVFRFFKLEMLQDAYRIKINIPIILSLLGVLGPMLFLGWVNVESYGNPSRLSGTVANIKSIDSQGLPRKDLIPGDANLNDIRFWENKTSGGFLNFFNPRNISNGLNVHLLSQDRGILFFAPYILFSLAGALLLYKNKSKILSLLLGIIFVNLIIYSMWGDPWGGWAFGSRYLIPLYAICSILLALGLEKIFKRKIVGVTFVIILIYSVFINTLGAITTSANPPKVEVLQLEELSGKEEKYTYERNWDYLNINGSKSFLYNSYLKDYLTPVQFYFMVSLTLSFFFLGLIFYEYLFSKLAGLSPLIKFEKNKVEGVLDGEVNLVTQFGRIFSGFKKIYK